MAEPMSDERLAQRDAMADGHSPPSGMESTFSRLIREGNTEIRRLREVEKEWAIAFHKQRYSFERRIAEFYIERRLVEKEWDSDD